MEFGVAFPRAAATLALELNDIIVAEHPAGGAKTSAKDRRFQKAS